jgi:hypothetical protein
VLSNSIEGNGHNPGKFLALTPMAVHVGRAETETAQVEIRWSSGFRGRSYCSIKLHSIGRGADKESEAQLKALKGADRTGEACIGFTVSCQKDRGNDVS